MKDLLLISGWGFASHTLEPLGECFKGTYNCHYTNTAELGSVEGLMQRLQEFDQPPYVAAWSLGGMFAIEAAQRHPELIKAMALIGTSLRFLEDEDYLWGFPAANLRAMKAGLRRDPENTMRQFAEQACSPLTTDSLPEDCLLFDQEMLLPGLEYLATADLRALDFTNMPPSCVFHGKKDQIMPVNAGRMISDRLKSLMLMRYDAPGHLVPLELPDYIAASVIYYFERL